GGEDEEHHGQSEQRGGQLTGAEGGDDEGQRRTYQGQNLDAEDDDDQQHRPRSRDTVPARLLRTAGHGRPVTARTQMVTRAKPGMRISSSMRSRASRGRKAAVT